MLLDPDEPTAVDAEIVAGYERQPAPEPDAWTFQGALATISAEPW